MTQTGTEVFNSSNKNHYGKLKYTVAKGSKKSNESHWRKTNKQIKKKQEKLKTTKTSLNFNIEVIKML